MAMTYTNGRIIRFDAADQTSSIDGSIDFIVWSGGTTAAHNITLEDTAGNILFEASITAAGETVMSPKFHDGMPFRGLKIEDLDSGTVLVYLR